eukprot:Gb_28495 [translate_table: standard]
MALLDNSLCEKLTKVTKPHNTNLQPTALLHVFLFLGLIIKWLSSIHCCNFLTPQKATLVSHWFPSRGKQRGQSSAIYLHRHQR